MCIVTRDQEENRVSILIFTTGDYKLLKKKTIFENLNEDGSATDLICPVDNILSP